MRVLALTSADRLPDFTSLYKALGLLVDIKVVVLNKATQRDLRDAVKAENLACYDRIFLDLHFKNIHRQGAFLATIKGLLVYEEDACQNYLTHSRWYGAFSRLYRQLPQAKILVTSASISKRLNDEGFDTYFFPKVFDPSNIFVEQRERDIEIGFIGRTASAAYSERKKFLVELAQQEPLRLLRTDPGTPYRNALNRIRYFVSADIGFSEYMAKNFEAMACGCLLLAWRQGHEELAIGLEEGRHLLLYSNLPELRGHLTLLRNNPDLAQRISDSGRAFVEKNLTYSSLATHIAGMLTMPWRTAPQPKSWCDFIGRLYKSIRKPR